MNHLLTSQGGRRILHGSTLKCIQSPSVIGETECKSLTTGNKSTVPEKNVSASERQDVSPTSATTLPEEPTTCCMSGCANCVWIEYADQMCKLIKSGEKAREIVLSKVTDPNMKAFLLLELKALENKDVDRTKPS